MPEQPKTRVVTGPAVTSTDSVTVTAPDIGLEQPKRPTSLALKSLADRRAALRDNLHLDLQVPRWDDPEIWVRFRPVDVTQTDRAIEKRREAKDKVQDWLIYANADILAMACEGVYAYAGTDTERENKLSLNVDDEHAPWTKFDADLAKALGLVGFTTAAEVVRAVYFTDGDLISTVNRLTEWSGTSLVKADTDF